MRALDLTGRKFGKLTVLERVGSNRGRAIWLCKCECDVKKVISTDRLMQGTQSCGCLMREMNRDLRTKHGNTARSIGKSREYRAWAAAKNRCYNSNDKGYPNYGGRGIGMHPEWINNFQSFLKYMLDNFGFCPPKYELDRYPNNNDNYMPGNVRWADKKQQNRNRRNAVIVKFEGRDQSLVELSERYNINSDLVYKRVKIYGWSIEEALTKEPKIGRPKGTKLRHETCT